MKYIFIVNPIAGKGLARNMTERIDNVCEEEKLDYIIHYTKEPEDATKLALDYKDGEHIIFSVGGDGTLTEVVNGIVGTKNKLGVIPGGSGNDFYKTMKDVTEEEKRIDIGKINDKYFINIVSVGIDAEVGNNINIFKKAKFPPKMIYNLSVMFTLFSYKLKNLTFNYNGKTKSDRYSLIAVCNGKYYGNGYKVAPDAQIHDHEFDLCFAKGMSKLAMISLVGKLKKGTHIAEKKLVEMGRTRQISISSSKELICNVDGETINGKNFDIELIEDGITIYNNRRLIRKILGKE